MSLLNTQMEPESVSSAKCAPDMVAGLVGRGIQKSLSPALHEGEAAAQGRGLAYCLLDLDALELDDADLGRVIDAAQLIGFAGLNITHPFKQRILPLLDELNEEARQVGAVNTLVFRDGRRIGHNTDCAGFAAGVRRGLKDAPMNMVAQLGAGGAGAATATAILREGCRDLRLFDSDHDRAQALATRLQATFPAARISASESPDMALDGAEGLINATPIGMSGHPGMPLPEKLLQPGLWVSEIIYFPLETELLRKARRLGCRTLDGSAMVVFQAALAFNLFTGMTADRDRMLAQFAKLNG